MSDFLSTYSYLLGSLYFLALWACLWWSATPEKRKESIFMGLLGFFSMLAGVGAYQNDWWHPTRLWFLHTPFGPFGIEDVLFGISVFGVTSILGQRLYSFGETGGPLPAFRISFKKVLLFSLAAYAVFLFFLYGLSLHSFYATLFTWIAFTAVILWRRRDLLVPMAYGGALLTLVCIPFYAIPLFFHPSWIANEWDLPRLSGIFLAGVPIEEFIWFFSIGSVVSVLWEWARSTRFERVTKTNSSG